MLQLMFILIKLIACHCSIVRSHIRFFIFCVVSNIPFFKEMKANHNYFQVLPPQKMLFKYTVLQRNESKSQRRNIPLSLSFYPPPSLFNPRYICTIIITNMSTAITQTVEVNAPIEKVWAIWNSPEDIMIWNNVSPDWHTPKVENDLRAGGQFLYVMGLKDGSFKFDFTGTYDEVKTNELISYTLNDGRRSVITFTGSNPIKVSETFEPNNTDDLEMQRDFCRAVLQSFKSYTEAKG
jgi:uncharacterized protein YndB with AHSA1/START domain